MLYVSCEGFHQLYGLADSQLAAATTISSAAIMPGITYQVLAVLLNQVRMYARAASRHTLGLNIVVVRPQGLSSESGSSAKRAIVKHTKQHALAKLVQLDIFNIEGCTTFERNDLRHRLSCRM